MDLTEGLFLSSLFENSGGGGGGGGGRTATFIATQTLTPEEVEEGVGVYASYPDVTTAPSSPETLSVTFNGTDYTVPYDYDNNVWGAHYDDDLGTFDWSVYPFSLYYGDMGAQLFTASASDVTISATFTQISITITQNGEYNVEGLETAYVNVPSGYFIRRYSLKEQSIIVQAKGTQIVNQSNFATFIMPGDMFAEKDTKYVAVGSYTNCDVSVTWSISGTTLNFTVVIHNNTNSDITIMRNNFPTVAAFSQPSN